jgi:dextranase
MQFIDLYPVKGTFKPGEDIEFWIEIESEKQRRASIQLSIFHLLDCILTETYNLTLKVGCQKLGIQFQLPSTVPYGYGVEANLIGENEEIASTISSAFDVLEEWVDFPRYGFLCDFHPDRSDAGETADALVRYHINGLQFYDWQYRHDHLISPTQEFVDPLGRELSLDTVKDLISTAHVRGMAAMPYLAVYAASIEFWRKHAGWGLYDDHGEPLKFEDFLGLMDPSPGSPWIRHLQSECDTVLSSLPFDGLHVDQYGEPKEGYKCNGERVDIPAAFHDFISVLNASHPQAAVVFNAVGNWPIEALATAKVDFVYIEIWPTCPRYSDVLSIVRNAQQLANGKPVVVALYLPADQHVNIRIADAILFAAGASRIELGEKDRLLTDPYFPNHQPVDPVLRDILRCYYDFVVRYGDWIGPTTPEVTRFQIEVPDDVWVIVRKCSGWFVINLINMSGYDEPCWDRPLSQPDQIENLLIKIVDLDSAQQAWWASPDRGDLRLFPLDYWVEGNSINLELPSLDYWSMVAVKIGE